MKIRKIARGAAVFTVAGMLTTCSIIALRPQPVAEALSPETEVILPAPAAPRADVIVQLTGNLEIQEIPTVCEDEEPLLEPERNLTEAWEPDEESVVYLAKTLWGECRGVEDKAQRAAVAWCVLNRVDSPMFKGGTVREIVTAKYQFLGYISSNPVSDELRELAIDVLTRYHAEKAGAEDVGRVLPADYFYFWGDGRNNYFRKDYSGGARWDFSLPNPYEEALNG